MHLDRISGGAIGHRLANSAEDGPSRNVTVILKSLYLTALGSSIVPKNSTGDRLLVTCSVRDDRSFADATYPVIFEEALSS